jgi:TldD protein
LLAVSRRLPSGSKIRPRLAGCYVLLLLCGSSALHAKSGGNATAPMPPLLETMTAELNRAMSSLGKQPEKQSDKSDNRIPPYFLSYSVADAASFSIRAQYGALVNSEGGHQRVVDVQVRVGDPKLDNTHGTHRGSAVNTLQLPLTDDREAIARSLWAATNGGYGSALDNYLRVKTEAEVRAKEEDASGDFSTEQPQIAIGKPAPAPVVNKAAWEERVRALSKIFREYPDVNQNFVMLTAESETDYFASS